jgi:putative SOS response-associated peptidase YedK
VAWARPVGALEEPEEGEVGQTFTTLNTTPTELCEAIHDRMPMILGRENWPSWLGEVDVTAAEELLSILRVFPIGMMDAYPVDRRVGNVRNNAPALFDEIAVAA